MTDSQGAVNWKEHQNTFDRVRSIAVTISEPKSADWIVEQAHVAGNTARDHLHRLVEMNVLQGYHRGTVTQYEPDPLYTRMQAFRDHLDGRNRDELIKVRGDLQEQVEEWKSDYDADSPSYLRELAAHADTASETREMRQTANDWDVITYRLRLVEDAIQHYSDSDRYPNQYFVSQFQNQSESV